MTPIQCITFERGEPPRAVWGTRDLETTSPGDIVVRVEYAGLNYKDALALVPGSQVIRDFPRIGGSDFAGVVLSSRDPLFESGDAVFGCARGLGVSRDGGFTQQVRVNRAHVHAVPPGLSTFEMAALGVAGMTAALALHLLEQQGLRPSQGPVAVSGASGGVGSLAVELLSRHGYAVVACSGKPEQVPWLRQLGAQEVIDPDRLSPHGKPLAPARWAGAIDTVGGAVLDGLIRGLQPRAAAACVGNVAGNTLTTSVLPFLLRGVRLVGVNLSEYADLTDALLAHLVRGMPAQAIAQVRVIAMREVPAWLQAMVRRETHGRIVMRAEGD